MSDKKPILVVRSVSLEKLSAVLNACIYKWPEHPVYVVSSLNRIAELELDDRVNKALACEVGAEGFRKPFAWDEPLEAVVFPIGNRSGGGYANVFKAFSQLKTKAFYCAAFCQELYPMSTFRLLLKCAVELSLEKLFVPLGVFVSLVIRRRG